MPDLVVVGASGHGRVALDIAEACGWRVSGFIDRAFEPGSTVGGIPILAREPEECRQLAGGEVSWFVAVGDNEVRRLLSERIRAVSPLAAENLIHPSAVVSSRAVLGRGVFIAPGAIINTGSRLADGVILNTAASLDHDGELGPYAQVSPGCRLAGNVRVGAGAFLGTGVSVIPGVTIGAGSTIGAGAVVVRDVPPGALALGVPARVRPCP